MAEVKIPTTIEPNTHAYRDAKAKMAEAEANSYVDQKVSEMKDHMKPVVDKSKMAKPESERKKKIRKIKDKFVKEVLVPRLKDGVMDLIGMIFYQDGRRSGGGYYNYGGSYRASSYRGSSYNYSSNHRDDYAPKNKKMDYRNVVLTERYDAEQIVSNLRGRIEQTGQASLGDLYDLIDVSSDFTDDNWGWTDPRDIGVRKVSNGWLVDVAEVRPL